MKKIVVL